MLIPESHSKQPVQPHQLSSHVDKQAFWALCILGSVLSYKDLKWYKYKFDKSPGVLQVTNYTPNRSPILIIKIRSSLCELHNKVFMQSPTQCTHAYPHNMHVTRMWRHAEIHACTCVHGQRCTNMAHACTHRH